MSNKKIVPLHQWAAEHRKGLHAGGSEVDELVRYCPYCGHEHGKNAEREWKTTTVPQYYSFDVRYTCDVCSRSFIIGGLG